ncbi:MAG TPA: transketolase C-terminal domain-containing protein [Symbiobacteriaceae bacterium]|nr:transketolase C-terminal domain-containing protein [Symbiobacteriaceae bacterium]
MELLQRVHAQNIVRWAKDKPDVVVFSADLTSSCEADLFRDTYPDRFFSMGLTEQNMLSMAGGMAREGFYPYIHTFAVFIYRRALDQIAMSVAYPNVPVRMVGFLPGILTPGGATHQAIEDIAVMRSLPNMTVLETGDATEVETILDAAQAVQGPVYIRMLRGEIPRLFDAAEPFVLNRARVLSRGTDLALITSGICTEEAMRVTQVLKEKGVSIEHLHVSTLKPFTDPQVLEAVSKVKHGVITMENHTVIGGLGSAVAEVMAENGIGRKLVRIGLPDTFAHGASRPYLMREYGLDAIALAEKVERLLGASFGISESDLKAVRLTAVHSEAKAEAL